MNNEPAPENEAELEAFRRRWREEVQSRNKNPQEPASPERTRPQQRRKSNNLPRTVPGPSTSRKTEEVDYEEVAPKAYHDLPNKDEALQLGATDGQNHERAKLFQEPNSALEHYEKAVEKESHGQLGDSLKHYRTAFKLDDGVHEDYKQKHFPASMFAKAKQATQQKPPQATSAPQSSKPAEQPAPPALPATLAQLVSSFSSLQIEPGPPPTELSPPDPCHLAEIPEEILSHILLELAVSDVASFARCAQVCKRLAFLVLTEDSIWKRVSLGSEVGFGAMRYDYATDIEGAPLKDAERQLSYDEDPEEDQEVEDPAQLTLTLSNSLVPSPYPSWRQLFRSRPRIRFNGCYISTVNYTRPGAHASNTLTWGAPVHIVTYFRYLRFFRDGTCLSLLTTTEPGDVVHHLTKENLTNTPPASLPGAFMKEALKGRWRLSGPLSKSSTPERSDPINTTNPTNTTNATTATDQAESPDSPPTEAEGDVHIETQGVVPRYIYKLQLGLGHAGKSGRNNKLAWKGFWSYNRLSDDWGEFMLRNDRAFYWSRVRSYGDGL